MPALPDRSGRAAARHDRRGRHRWRLRGDQRRARAGASRRRRSRSSRRTRWAGAPRPATAGSSTRATNGARASSSSATARRPGTALYRETLDGYETVKRLIAEESIDCDFREVGHVELAYAPSHVPGLEHAREAWRRSGSSVDARAARAAPRGDRHATPTTGHSSCRAARCSTRAATSPAWPPRRIGPAPTSTKVFGREPSGARRTAGSSSRPTRGAILARDVVRRHERLHRRRRPDAPPPDHPDRQLHHRQRAAPR